MIVFKCNEHLSREEWDMWKDYIECHYQDKVPMFIPDFIDVLEINEGEEVEYEEE